MIKNVVSVSFIAFVLLASSWPGVAGAMGSMDPADHAELLPQTGGIVFGEVERGTTHRGVSRSVMMKAGYIAPRVESQGQIIKNLRNNVKFGEGEIVYTNIGTHHNAKVGKKYTVFKVVRPVFHPVLKGPASDPNIIMAKPEIWQSGIDYSNVDFDRDVYWGSNYAERRKRKPMGNLVKVLGTLEILEADASRSKAKIIESFDYISNGDHLVPFKEPKLPPVNVDGPAKNTDSYIIAANKQNTMLGEWDVIFIDRGKRHNVAPGDRLEIYTVPEVAPPPRLYDSDAEHAFYKKHDHELLMPFVIGHGLVLDAKTETATVLILDTNQRIKMGDKVRSPR